MPFHFDNIIRFVAAFSKYTIPSQKQCCNGFIEFYAFYFFSRHINWHAWEKEKEIKIMLTLLLIVAGLIGFALFFKAIDFFEKI